MAARAGACLIRLIWAIVLMLAVFVAGLGLGWWCCRARPGGQSAGPSLERIQRLATLVTIRVDLSDVQVSSARGYVGGMRVALLVKGDALLGTDLSRGRFEKFDRQARSAVLVLPQPQVTSPRLDQEQTRLFAVDTYGLWLLVPGDGRNIMVNRAYAQAQEAVAHAAADPQLVDKARQQAQEVLGWFFAQQGWTLSITWVE
jgi:hypothetical protein